jgi:site-specific recombinase
VASSGPQPIGDRWSAPLLGGLFVAVSVIVDLLLYYSFPADHYFWALLGIGIFSLLFALIAALAQSLSRQPIVQRALSWGYLGLGFAVLFLTVALGPSYGALTVTGELIGLLLLVVALAVAVALVSWRGRALRSTENREVARAAWRQEPTQSAFTYATAGSPSVPEASPPVPPNAPPARRP